MQYVSSFEEFLMEKGEQKGMEKGMEQGIKQGIKQGEQKGESNLLSLLLATRFGSISADIHARLTTASTDQIERWATRVFEAQKLEDVFGD